ncbi:MAG: N-acetyltransferase family protein [Christensenellales bacterium]
MRAGQGELPETGIAAPAGYHIREMREADWPEVSRIYQQGIDSGLATFETRCPSLEQWEAAHLPECRLVILREGSVLGFAALSAVSSRAVYAGVAEVSIYIDAGSRGQGLGKTLLTALLKCSRDAGFWTLQSGILAENLASIRLHECCGFRRVGYRERIARDSQGLWRSTLLMENNSLAGETSGFATAPDKTADYAKKELDEALKAISSIISKCEKVQPKLRPGSAQASLLKHRIKALRISGSLIRTALGEGDQP